jgi:DNA topoisomerase-1
MIQEPPTGTITSNAVRPWTTSAPQPLITSTLQQQASALFSIPPKSAMQAAQRLYEAGHITYMRTDKAVLSEEAKTSIRNYVTETYGAEYVGEMKTEVDEEKDKDKEKDKKKTKKAKREKTIEKDTRAFKKWFI